ncbi:unnamed protein product [Camellia sinensis]
MRCRDRLHELVKEEIEKKDSSMEEWKIAMKSSFNHMDNEGEPSFHLFGFIMCHGATAARALKSLLQGILLSSKGIEENKYI